ncbi:hypothetical protein MMC11_002147 [Xylographa trunciseda]|nr:hypothetical protein [Xylographa trunciseda]
MSGSTGTIGNQAPSSEKVLTFISVNADSANAGSKTESSSDREIETSLTSDMEIPSAQTPQDLDLEMATADSVRLEIGRLRGRIVESERWTLEWKGAAVAVLQRWVGTLNGWQEAGLCANGDKFS